jgi:hypothetical protein
MSNYNANQLPKTEQTQQPKRRVLTVYYRHTSDDGKRSTHDSNNIRCLICMCFNLHTSFYSLDGNSPDRKTAAPPEHARRHALKCAVNDANKHATRTGAEFKRFRRHFRLCVQSAHNSSWDTHIQGLKTTQHTDRDTLRWVSVKGNPSSSFDRNTPTARR